MLGKYFFHLTERERMIADEEGLTLSGDEAARAEAIKQIRSIVAEETRETGVIWLSRHIDVADGKGTIVARVGFGDALRIHHG